MNEVKGNRETAIALINAFFDGKEIELYDPEAGVKKWTSINDPNHWNYLSQFLKNLHKYRIKEDLEYLPYTTIEEILQDQKLHGPNVRFSEYVYNNIKTISKVSTTAPISVEFHTPAYRHVNVEEMLEKGYTWQDGTPFGIKNIKEDEISKD